ncbi:asparaginase [Mesorhizobium sp. M1C.F.Ca.ET.193.01.1.1]|uniref:asparaginase n=1 Tax=unclassified Mesorhizobium TaxID=325217 RepID=UPI000FD38CE1|nr:MULTISPECIES: asparaginase [unclassified Mesorhizobium]TGS94473.1 asparaginase [bacterium M00.F.Ca.ET.177.01.1.1]TGQ51175.1 asparaginase [Mesorhizobium sp. M1C.F.Ca.ET.210.01.1.1]TGQ66963.1 asparaginase [Mesorhizobium sp. M1C.F.Ca.ET.212.01.1.1]TGR01086.1 asparaginase [Mesorhizobium sp. M1C.F.Ca.ET.204.01.1.1]TGR21765.1 asparaginase [Mesorhizobium sp. M1C.F.Ca.ET.196.01.1.1]
MTKAVPEVAFIGTGGTIASIGKDAFDVLDYGNTDNRLHAEEIIAKLPPLDYLARVTPVRFNNIESTAVTAGDWRDLALLCTRLAADNPELAGIVIGHGTATLEETAYCLSLTLKLTIPVVFVGSQRPLNGISSDAQANLVAAIRVAVSPDSIGRGVLVVLNDEVHAARDVSKRSTFRLHAFQSPDFGVLGQVDGETVRYYRRTERRHTLESEFSIADIAAMPRVDVAYSYAGSDGTAIRAFAAAGAKGIVLAGFAPGMGTPAEVAALEEAIATGIVALQSSKVGSGAALDSARHRAIGIFAADNLSPQKARILLGLGLARTQDHGELKRMFATY